MPVLIRTNSDDLRFTSLVRMLDEELVSRDRSDHAFYAQFNKIDSLKYVVVAMEDNESISCGAMKEIDPGVVEIKRMYTLNAWRGQGLAGRILAELEAWAKELSMRKCVLETGRRQPEAIALYKKNGYDIIPNYGQYAGIDNSVCFEKILPG